jgi:DNA-binding MarR family transcriptional regulator
MNAHIETEDDSARGDALARLGRDFDHIHSLAAPRIFSHMARSMHSGEVSFSQINALFRLYRHGPQRIVDLADGAHLSQCAVSRLVSRLVREGLVEKQENPASRRERLIRLSAAGRAYLRDLQQKTAAAYGQLFQSAPPALTQRLLDVLDEMLPFLPPHELAT